MINPFTKDREHVEVLVNISTGLHASIAVQNSLLNCVKHGQEYVDVFIHEVFDKSGDKNFHDPIKQYPLKSFAQMAPKAKFKAKDGYKLAQCSPELIMRWGKAISERRPDLNLDLLTIISLPFGGSPPSLFYEDGLMRKPSNKADIAQVLKRYI